MGEMLNIEDHDALLAYLIARGHVDAGVRPALRTLAGGVSNRTVLVELPDGEGWVLKQALPKLRVEVDWFSDPERVRQEANGVRWLTRLAPPGSTPGLVFEDYDQHLMAMQAVPQPHENWKTMLLAGRLDADHVRQFGTLLGTIHRNACDTRYAAEVRTVFDNRSYFESLRIEPYYSYTATRVPAAEPFLTALIAETLALRLTLTHGDYSPKNVLVHAGRLVLLDHEVAHWGDPAFDLGFSLTHLLSKAHHVAPQRQGFAAAAANYWRTYRDTLGGVAWAPDLEARAVRHTLGCLLARVAGRSPLEYMSPPERERQRDVVVALMQRPPATVDELVAQFVARL